MIADDSSKKSIIETLRKLADDIEHGAVVVEETNIFREVLQEYDPEKKWIVCKQGRDCSISIRYKISNLVDAK